MNVPDPRRCKCHRFGRKPASCVEHIDMERLLLDRIRREIAEPHVFYRPAPASCSFDPYNTIRSVKTTIVRIHIADAARSLAANHDAAMSL